MTHHRFPLAGLALALALPVGLAACAEDPPVTVHDDLDLHLDFWMTESDLETPYVRGASIRIDADSEDGADAAWHITAADPRVFRATSSEPGATTFLAAASGKTALIATRGRESVRVGTVDVALPTRLELFAHGPLMVHRRDPPTARTIEVVVGGTATFLVRYFRGDAELHGNGVLTVDADPDLDAEPETTFLFENREWLAVTPRTLGPHTMTLSADGAPIATFTVVGVPEEAVAAMTLSRESERDAEKGDLLYVLAEGFGEDGEPILGIAPEWELEDVRQAGTGDMFLYEFDGSQPRQLHAHTSQAGSTIALHTGGGFVTSSNVIGCAGGEASIGLGLGLVAVALLARRRVTVARG